MMINGETVIAKCSFGRGNRHTAYLTPEALLVKILHREIQRFDRNSILEIRVRHRILWLPLVLGGIITPFAFIALLKGIGAFWLLFLLALAGMFLFYYGYNGSDSLTVSTSVKEYDYFIDQNKPHLKAFVQFVSGQLFNNDPLLYIHTTRDQWEQWHQDTVIPGGTEVFPGRWVTSNSELIISIDPQRQDTPLDFRITNDFSEARSFLRKDMPVNLFEIAAVPSSE